jgi:Holliday junction resolvasome RuvABC endonuclease subunit
MRLIGLDLSLTSTGVSVNGDTQVLSIKEKGAERLSLISNKILEICISEKISCALIEGYSFSSRNSQAHSIGELGGCVRMRLWENGIPFVDIPPTCRAKFATGKGNASKGEVISAISAKTGKVFSGAGGNDECDAWVLEQMGITYLGNSDWDWTREQLSALAKVDWTAIDNIENNEKNL